MAGTIKYIIIQLHPAEPTDGDTFTKYLGGLVITANGLSSNY
jgi:hypothetical protein